MLKLKKNEELPPCAGEGNKPGKPAKQTSRMLKLRKSEEQAPDAGKGRKPGGNPQGITTEGNALQKIALKALLIIMIPAALGFSYLALIREPAIQDRQIEQIASFYATQQASGLHRMLTRLNSRIRGAALSPLALSAIASQSSEEISALEETMLRYFPELTSLRIIPIGEMGTAGLEGGNQGLRNHIELDMVRRTSNGEETYPEAYRFEQKWLTSITALVTHPQVAERNAVIIATLDNKLLAAQLMPLNPKAGKFNLEQVFTKGGGEKINIVASAGAGDVKQFTSSIDIPDTAWRVSFIPSSYLVDTMGIKPMPLLSVLILVMLAALGAIATVLVLYPRALAEQIDKVIAAADKKSPLELNIPELVAIARQLRRATLRSMRQVRTGPAAQVANGQPPANEGTADSLTNPMFQSDSMLDDSEEVLELDLVEAEEPAHARPVSEEGFPEHIFRAYDIRGEAEAELGDDLVGRIGRAVGSIAGEMNEQTLIVACDGRASSPRIKSCLIRALMDSGRDVIDIGLVPTPLLYFATRQLNCRSGIMVTGSHNPAQDNGLKIVLNQQTIAAGGIQDIRDRVVTGSFSKGSGRMIREDIVPAYMDEVLQDIAIAVPLKIVIDAGNGATSEIAPALFEDLGCEVIPLYCEIDGRFPHHSPDTSNEDNLTDLVRAVERENADFGVAFDGDGDRLAVVTSSGRIVRSDVLLMIYAQDVVARNPGADVVFDVKCSSSLTDLITLNGGRPVLWKTGHAFMKEKMAETGALLGGEFSGHMFFGERWYGFDDGMYAAGRLAEILSTLGESLDETISAFPESVNTPEIIIPVPESDKFPLMAQIVAEADFSAGKITTMDGLRVDFNNGWGLVRASNTSAALTARFEASDEETLELIKEEFRTQINLADPSLELAF